MSHTKIIISTACIGCIVLAASYYKSERAQFRACQNIEKISKVGCWEDATRRIVKNEGIEEAFDFIAYAYDHDPEFARSCHAMVHIIGQTAYSQFRATGEVALSEHTASCAFGFYHGFMEMLVARKGTIAQARDFCNFVDKTLGEITPGAKYSCYHGIGHGSADVHNPKYYGDERALIVPALANCEAFAKDEHELTLCATGIFDSISIAYYNNGQNGFVIKKEDPLWLCHEQPKKYKEACYRDMMPAIIWMGEYDLAKAIPIALSHVEKEYQLFSLKILAENSVRYILNKTPVSSYVPLCRSLNNDISLVCVEGLALGVMQFGPPGKEYVGALGFCREDDLTKSEREVCMKEVLGYAKSRYGKKIVAGICEKVEEKYASYCR